jgi:hypothetical protein
MKLSVGLGALQLLFLVPYSAQSADVDLTKGRFTNDGFYATQTIGATNNTNSTLRFLGVECGFFRKDTLLVSGEGNTQDVHPKQTAYFQVIADHADGTDKTDCRVKTALPAEQAAPKQAAPAPSWDEVLALRAVVSVLITMSVIDHTRNGGKDPQAFLDVIAKTSVDAVNTAGISGADDPDQIRQAATERLKEMFAGIHFGNSGPGTADREQNK